MARFALIHLTPATRTAFREYRDAQRVCLTAGEKMELAWRALVGIRQDAARLGESGVGIHPEFLARVDRLTEAHRAAEATWQATTSRAQAAADVAVPLLTGEGYPFGWWYTGSMRLPAGVESPGANRLSHRR